MRSKMYVACQAWCTPLATQVLTSLSSGYTFMKDYNSFIPGVAVTVSHFAILGLSLLNVPSVEEMRVQTEIKSARKKLEKYKKTPGLSLEEIAKIDEALLALRNKEIAKCLSDVDHTLAVLAKAQEEDSK
jgi:hypothetical protein